VLRRNVETAAGQEAIAQVRRLVRLWDEAIRVPGLGWRVGLDPLVGLVPGVGDLIGLLVSLGPVVTAVRLGANGAVVARMLLNVVLDAVVGAVPIAGDLFDVAWRANRRNLNLLERWLAEPHQVQRSSWAILLGLVVGAAGATAGVVWLVVQTLLAVWRALT